MMTESCIMYVVFIAILMLQYITKYKYIATNILNVFMKIFLHKSAQYKVSQSVPVFIRTMALLYVSQQLFILFPLFYQVDSFSFFYFYFYATPPSCLSGFLAVLMMNKKIASLLLRFLDITHFHIIPAPRGFIALYPVCLNLEYSLIIDKAG